MELCNVLTVVIFQNVYRKRFLNKKFLIQGMQMLLIALIRVSS